MFPFRASTMSGIARPNLPRGSLLTRRRLQPTDDISFSFDGQRRSRRTKCSGRDGYDREKGTILARGYVDYRENSGFFSCSFFQRRRSLQLELIFFSGWTKPLACEEYQKTRTTCGNVGNTATRTGKGVLSAPLKAIPCAVRWNNAACELARARNGTEPVAARDHGVTGNWIF